MDDVETLIDLDSQENDFCEPTPEPHLGFHVISAGAPSYQHLSPGSWKPAITGEKRDLAEAVAPETPTRTEGDTTQKPAIVQCVKVRRPQQIQQLVVTLCSSNPINLSQKMQDAKVSSPTSLCTSYCSQKQGSAIQH